MVAPIAGFYAFAYPYDGPNASSEVGLSDFREPAWQGYAQLWQSHVDEDCAKALRDRPWACLLSNYSRPYIRVPAFVTEAQTDLVQLTKHDDVPEGPDLWNTEIWDYLHAWASNMSWGLAELPPGDGIFAPACLIHTAFNKDFPLANGSSGQAMNYGQAFAAWLAGEEVRVADSCGVLCGRCPTSPREVVSSGIWREQQVYYI